MPVAMSWLLAVNLAIWLMLCNFAALRYYSLDFPTADSCISA